MILGFGISSFIDLLKTLIALFFVLSIVHIPLMRDYSSWSPISEQSLLNLNSYVLGNMGQSETKCLHTHLSIDSQYVGCETGNVTAISHFGVFEFNSQADILDRCVTKFDDPEQAGCIGLSSKDSHFYT